MSDTTLCACMGVRQGDQYCCCEMKRRGMDVSHYVWTEDEKEQFKEALSKMFNWDKEK